MLKAVLFDLDNTLIDYMKMKRLSCEAALSAMIESGLEMEHGKAYHKLFELYEEVGIEHGLIFQKFLRKHMGKVDYRILSNAVAAYRKVQVGFQEPYPGVVPTLLALRGRGLKLGVVSDAPKLKAWLRLAEIRLTDFFDVVVALGDTQTLKPGRKPFELASRRLGVKAEHVLYVGDNPGRDIKGAARCGMRTALAEYGRIFPLRRGIKPDYQLKRFKDLLEVVETECRGGNP